MPQKKIKHLIVIEGPTASGKTSLSIALAKHYDTCVVSADSRQFYKELSIGTAKPSEEEQDGVTHYFIDSHNLEDEVTAAQYEKEALQLLEEEFKKQDVIILTGGSGMFIDALCIGLDNIPASKELRNELNTEFETNGLDPLLSELEQKDPTYFEEVDRSNPVRVMRALEAIRISGKTYSSLRENKPAQRPFEVHRYVINHDREVLYDRINLRVDIMMSQGLLDEVKSVEKFRNLSSMNTVGYKEIFEFLDDKTTLPEAVEKLKMNTRRYAKRQLTWFRRHKDAVWVSYDDTVEMQKEITSDFKRKIS